MSTKSNITVWWSSIRNRSLAELLPYASLAVVAALIFVFGKLAGAVLDGDTRSFDEFVLRALRNPADLADPIGPAWLESVVRDITSLGSFSVLTIVTLSVVGVAVLVVAVLALRALPSRDARARRLAIVTGGLMVLLALPAVQIWVGIAMAIGGLGLLFVIFSPEVQR